MSFLLRKSFIILTLLSLVAFVVAYGKGARFSWDNKTIVKTGILATTSSPSGAKVNINGKFIGATDSNFSLEPNKYEVMISKEGYLPWKKNIEVKSQQVHRADSWLFNKNPSLFPQSSQGISYIISSPSGEKTLFYTPNSSDDKVAGIFLFQGNKKNLLTSNASSIILDAKLLPNKDQFLLTNISFSPDESEILMTYESKQKKYTALLSLDGINNQLVDVTKSSATIVQAWEKRKESLIQKYFAGLPKNLQTVAKSSWGEIKISPNGKKVLYKSLVNFEFPSQIVPALLGTNQKEEERKLIKNKVYVYDLVEDKNYLISGFESTSLVSWYISSSHLYSLLDTNGKKSIILRDYDNSNITSVYSGPISKNFVNTTTDGDIMTLINFSANEEGLPDLYFMSIR